MFIQNKRCIPSPEGLYEQCVLTQEKKTDGIPIRYPVLANCVFEGSVEGLEVDPRRNMASRDFWGTGS